MAYITNHAGITHAVPDEDVKVHLKARTGQDGHENRPATAEEIAAWEKRHLPRKGKKPADAADESAEETE